MTKLESAEMAELNLDPARLKDRQAQVSAMLANGSAAPQQAPRRVRSDAGKPRPPKPAPEPPAGKIQPQQRDRLQVTLDKWMQLCEKARDVIYERDRAGEEYRACLDDGEVMVGVDASVATEGAGMRTWDDYMKTEGYKEYQLQGLADGADGPEVQHCKDCCCAQSWKALGITAYTGKSIPEHITKLLAALASKDAEIVRLRGNLAMAEAAMGIAKRIKDSE